MVNRDTDFFQIIDNFSRIKGIPSLPLIRSGLNTRAKVTIVIPTYKRPGLLKETLDSALQQSDYQEYKVLIVDNNPERNCETEKLINTYSDERLSYYKNAENLGMINNWNRCIELVDTEWLVMLHDDDLLLPGFIKRCMDFVAGNPDTGALKPRQYHWRDPTEKPQLHDFDEIKTGRRIYELDYLLATYIVPPTGILFNREKVYLAGGFNPDFYPDADLCFMVLYSYLFKVYQMDQVLSVYRWLSNDSLKISTLQNFIINDYYLYSYLYRRFRFPRKISSAGLNMRFENIEKAYQVVNKEFKFDVKTLGIIPMNRISMKIYSFLLRLIIFLSRMIYKLFEAPIFKRRSSYLHQESYSNISS